MTAAPRSSTLDDGTPVVDPVDVVPCVTIERSHLLIEVDPPDTVNTGLTDVAPAAARAIRRKFSGSPSATLVAPSSAALT